jgi:hypothetical protein
MVGAKRGNGFDHRIFNGMSKTSTSCTSKERRAVTAVILIIFMMIGNLPGVG